MQNQKLTIPIDSIERDFDDFLSPDSNKRIIFSGPFGIGKTYFLDKFFKNRNPKYLPIFLRPVNYSLLSNEDVFRLIKYDILLQLINVDGFKIEKEFAFSKTDYSKFFIGQNSFLILHNLLKLIPKIQSTVDGIDNLAKLFEAYKKGKEDINTDSDLKMLYDFKNETQDNFLLEYDHVSQFVASKLDDIVEINKTYIRLQKVLIIDDLDRLDPEHIFRLFNVFSAHFDHVNYYPNDENIKDNKFGFDKIIFVCDIENIRKIFAHKYGADVDFSGYIDKFYSSKIYHFNKNKSIQKFIDEIFRPHASDSFRIEIINIIKLIFRDLIEANCINHRMVENITNEKIRLKKSYTIDFWSPTSVRSDEFIFIQVLDFLFDVFGKNYEALHKAIKKASELKKNLANRDINKHIIHLLPLLSLTDLKGSAQHSWENPQNSNAISYQIEHGVDGLYYATIKSHETSWMSYQNYYSLLLIVTENLKDIGIFVFEPE